MWELDHNESWTPKNWCSGTVVLEKTLENPLDCKEIQPVHPKGDQSWRFVGRTDAEAGTQILWPPDVKNWLFWKGLDAGKDWRWEEKGTTEEEMIGWHHWLNGHGFEPTPGIVKDRQAWCAAVYESQKCQTQLSDWTTTSMVVWSLVFKEISIPFSTVAVLIYIPINSVRRFHSYTPSPAFIVCGFLFVDFFDIGHSVLRWYLIVSFDLHYSKNKEC